MLTGKQRSYLKSLAQKIDDSVYIGKAELTDNILKEIDNYLEAHELCKVKLQECVLQDPKELANKAADAIEAEFVQAIGRKFVLYKRSKKNPVIELPK